MAVLYRMMHKSQVTSPCSSSSSSHRCRPTNRVGPISLSDCCISLSHLFLKSLPSSMCITGQIIDGLTFFRLQSSRWCYFIDPPKLDATLEGLIEILRLFSRPRYYIMLRKISSGSISAYLPF